MLQQLENRKLELGRPVDKLATIVLERQASCIKPRRSMGGSDQRILELGNVWIFVQLIFGPHWPMNQLNKNPDIV